MELEINGRRYPVCPGSGRAFEPRCPVCNVPAYAVHTTDHAGAVVSIIGTHPTLRGK